VRRARKSADSEIAVWQSLHPTLARTSLNSGQFLHLEENLASLIAINKSLTKVSIILDLQSDVVKIGWKSDYANRIRHVCGPHVKN